MKFLVPLSTQPVAVLLGARASAPSRRSRPPARTARSSRSSCPPPASGSQRARCASVPSPRIGAHTSEHCTDIDDRRRRAGARDLLQRHRVGEGVHARRRPSAPGPSMPSSPSSPSRAKIVVRELVAAVDLGGARQDLARREVARGVAGSASARATARSSCAFPRGRALLDERPHAFLLILRSRTAPRTARARAPARAASGSSGPRSAPGVTVCFAAATASGAWPAICAASARTRGISASGSTTALHEADAQRLVGVDDRARDRSARARARRRRAARAAACRRSPG